MDKIPQRPLSGCTVNKYGVACEVFGVALPMEPKLGPADAVS